VIRALLACVLLAGCAEPPPTLKYPGFILTIHIDPNLSTLGLSERGLGVCKITLREYPVCLLHEVRHCAEGDWHVERESDTDCF
jgi:hypothetical protein